MNLTAQLFQLLHDVGHLGVEITLVSGAMLVLVVGLFRIPSIVIKGVAAVTVIVALAQLSPSGEYLFGDMLVSSRLSWAMVRICLVAVLLVLLFRTSAEQRSSYYFLMLTILTGAILMMHARHFLLIYLAVEMVSYGAYVLTNFSFSKNGHEAGLKYLLFGGICSAVMLFGISLIYGVQGHLYLTSAAIDSPYEQMAATFIFVGIFFKISAVPFHVWVPNVYQSAPVDTAAFFSIVPKVAGLILLSNVLTAWNWGHPLVLFFGLASILVGTFGAIGQSNVRRLVSYGAIAHTGLLIPFVLWEFSAQQFVWYVAIYAAMNVAVFYALQVFESHGMHLLEAYAGAGKKLVGLGVFFTIVLVALIGLPPTVGFTAKWMLFSGLWAEYRLTDDGWVLAYFLTSLFATAVAVYYYLRPSYQLFLVDGTSDPAPAKRTTLVILGVFGLAMIALFVFPELLRWFY